MLDFVPIGFFGASLLDGTIIQFSPQSRLIDNGPDELPGLVIDRFINFRDGSNGDLLFQIDLNLVNPDFPKSSQPSFQPLESGGFMVIFVFGGGETDLPEGFVAGTFFQEFTSTGVPVDPEPVRIADGSFGGFINLQDGGFIVSQGVNLPGEPDFAATAVTVSPSGEVESTTDISAAPVPGLGIELDNGTFLVGDGGATRLVNTGEPLTLTHLASDLSVIGSITVDALPGGVQGANFAPLQLTRLPNTDRFVVAFVEDPTGLEGDTSQLFIAFGDGTGAAPLVGLNTLIEISSDTIQTVQILPFADGTFVIAWQQGGSDGEKVQWRHVDNDGSFLGPLQNLNASRFFEGVVGEGLAALDALVADGAFSITAFVTFPATGTILGTVVEGFASETEQFDFDIALAGDRTVLGETDDFFTGDAANEFIDGAGGADTVLAGGGNDTVIGGAGGDLVDGGDGNDIIEGGLDIDILIGGVGNDHLMGGEGDDLFSGGLGVDIIDGGAGTLDIAAYADATAGIVVDLVGSSSAGEFANDIVIDIEGFQGARNFANTFLGAGGADIFLGGLLGDLLQGGAGNDVLFGDLGDDTLNGDAGADLIQGGRGADLLSGGGPDNAQDVFVFERDHDANTITDFEVGTDVILFQRTGLALVDVGFQDNGTGVLLSLAGGTTTVQIEGVSESDLDGFVFVL